MTGTSLFWAVEATCRCQKLQFLRFVAGSNSESRSFDPDAPQLYGMFTACYNKSKASLRDGLLWVTDGGPGPPQLQQFFAHFWIRLKNGQKITIPKYQIKRPWGTPKKKTSCDLLSKVFDVHTCNLTFQWMFWGSLSLKTEPVTT